MANNNGIDISEHQGTIDFKKVKKSGIDFAILREGYRQNVDNRFFEYVKGCRENNIDIPAVYHFLYCISKAEAIAEAKSCIRNIKKAGLPKSIIVFSDFEYDTVKKGKARGKHLGYTECNLYTEAFLDTIAKAGYSTGIYSNIDYYKNMYSKELIGKHIFWLADYTGGPDYKCNVQQTGSKGKVSGISGYVDMDVWYVDTKNVEEKQMVYSRQKVVDQALSWLGKNEADGSYKSIIDIYNSYSGGFPRGVKMQYGWAWCACTWSAIAIKLGYTEIMPIEISVGFLVEAAKKMGCWQENDSYIPQPADAVIYDWDDSGKGDNTNWPDHIGVVVEVNYSDGYFVVVEGNYNGAVKKRMVSINGKYIRGFIVPKYTNNVVSNVEQRGGKTIDQVAHEVIAGTWGNDQYRVQQLKVYGYDAKAVQARVNEILGVKTTTNNSSVKKINSGGIKEVKAIDRANCFNEAYIGEYREIANQNMRTGAGTNKKVLVVIPRGTTVECNGYYSVFNGDKWYYVTAMVGGVKYSGFCWYGYLARKK